MMTVLAVEDEAMEFRWWASSMTAKLSKKLKLSSFMFQFTQCFSKPTGQGFYESDNKLGVIFAKERKAGFIHYR